MSVKNVSNRSRHRIRSEKFVANELIVGVLTSRKKGKVDGLARRLMLKAPNVALVTLLGIGGPTFLKKRWPVISKCATYVFKNTCIALIPGAAQSVGFEKPKCASIKPSNWK